MCTPRRILAGNLDDDNLCTYPNQDAITSDAATRELFCWAALDKMAVYHGKPGKSAKVALRGGYGLVCFLQNTSVGSDEALEYALAAMVSCGVISTSSKLGKFLIVMARQGIVWDVDRW